MRRWLGRKIACWRLWYDRGALLWMFGTRCRAYEVVDGMPMHRSFSLLGEASFACRLPLALLGLVHNPESRDRRSERIRSDGGGG